MTVTLNFLRIRLPPQLTYIMKHTAGHCKLRSMNQVDIHTSQDLPSGFQYPKPFFNTGEPLQELIIKGLSQAVLGPEGGNAEGLNWVPISSNHEGFHRDPGTAHGDYGLLQGDTVTNFLMQRRGLLAGNVPENLVGIAYRLEKNGMEFVGRAAGRGGRGRSRRVAGRLEVELDVGTVNGAAHVG